MFIVRASHDALFPWLVSRKGETETVQVRDLVAKGVTFAPGDAHGCVIVAECREVSIGSLDCIRDGKQPPDGVGIARAFAFPPMQAVHFVHRRIRDDDGRTVQGCNILTLDTEEAQAGGLVYAPGEPGEEVLAS